MAQKLSQYENVLYKKIKLFIQVNLGEENRAAAEDTIDLVDRVGHAIINYVDIEIGGQTIDKHYGQWLDLWTQLSHCQEQYAKLERIINGNTFQLQ